MMTGKSGFLLEILKSDSALNESLSAIQALGLPDWCIVGGAIRDKIWSEILGRAEPSRDIDVVFFDDSHATAERDTQIESTLLNLTGIKHSVKNQARMHLRNRDLPYLSTIDAMSKFPTTVSANGCKLDSLGGPILFSIFGFHSLIKPEFKPTPYFSTVENGNDRFLEYLHDRQLTDRWYEVPVIL